MSLLFQSVEQTKLKVSSVIKVQKVEKKWAGLSYDMKWVLCCCHTVRLPQVVFATILRGPMNSLSYIDEETKAQGIS